MQPKQGPNPLFIRPVKRGVREETGWVTPRSYPSYLICARCGLGTVVGQRCQSYPGSSFAPRLNSFYQRADVYQPALSRKGLGKVPISIEYETKVADGQHESRLWIK